MIDPLLLPLAKEAFACYDDDPKFVWEGENKTSHLRHTVIDGIHTFTFAGTMPDFSEWFLDTLAIPLPIPDVPAVGDLHAGFSIGAVGAICEYILPTLSSLKYPSFRLVGHSKGAAQAGQAHGILKAMGLRPTMTRLFEPPLFGGQMIADLMKVDDVEWTQTFNCHRTDLVTHLPVGPTWKRHKPPILLRVHDDTDIERMHRMPDVISAIETLVG